MDKSNEYKTKSINLAAILLTKNFKFTGIEGERDKYFKFCYDEEIDGVVTEFINKKLEVNVNEFLNHLKNLKNFVKQ